jgi:GTP-binding protein HflX
VLHVIDAATQDRGRRMNAVHVVLDEVGAVNVPLLEVYNKCDALTPDERRRLQDQDPSALCISALQRQGIDELIETITSRLALDVCRVTLTFDPTAQTIRADCPRLPSRRIVRGARQRIDYGRCAPTAAQRLDPRRTVSLARTLSKVNFS